MRGQRKQTSKKSEEGKLSTLGLKENMKYPKHTAHSSALANNAD